MTDTDADPNKNLIQTTTACIEKLLDSFHKLREEYAGDDADRMIEATSLQLGMLSAVATNLTARSASCLNRELYNLAYEEMGLAMKGEPE